MSASRREGQPAGDARGPVARYTPISHRSPAYRVIFIYIILSRATHFYYTEIHGPGVAQTRSHMRAALATHAVHLHLPVTLRKVCMQVAGRSVARNALGRPLPSLSLVILAPYLHNSACNDPAPRHTHTRSTSLHNVLVARRDGSARPLRAA